MIAWFDCETTGLSPKNDVLLEVGIIITDDELEPVAQRSALIHHDVRHSAFVKMDPFVLDMHTTNGLLVDIERTTMLTPEVEDWMVEFMDEQTGSNDLMVMGGSSLTHDRGFLAEHMPVLLSKFHYRSIDVTTVRELAHRWHPELTPQEPVAPGKHRVLDDCRDSIRLLAFYRKYFVYHKEYSNEPS